MRPTQLLRELQVGLRALSQLSRKQGDEMSNEQIAKAAFIYSRQQIHLKSSNKLDNKKAESNVPYVKRQNKAFDELKIMNSWMDKNKNTVTLTDASEKIRASGAGNCMGYAIVALHHMRTVGGASKSHSGYVSVDGFDHAFAQVGYQVPSDGNYPINFEDWEDAWIADGWANICCPAKEFKLQLTEKMKKWSQNDKVIIGQYYDVNPADWVVGVPTAKKIHSPIFDR
ncbi:hypothetical protein [Azospirillum endophyticum]